MAKRRTVSAMQRFAYSLKGANPTAASTVAQKQA